MLMVPIESPLTPASHRVVRMVRRWVASVELGAARLPALVRLGRRLGLAPEATIALGSMFQLTESCLGRPLEAECCCSPALARDERAILMMLATASWTRSHRAIPSIPHGLPGALHWAIASVRRAMEDAVSMEIGNASKCPFAG